MILLLFLLTADTTLVSGNFLGRLAIKLPSLGVLNLGYINPALSQGLNGWIFNPAALSEAKVNSFSSAIGLGSTTSLEVLPTLDMGEEIGFVEIPCNLSFVQPVSLNMMSVAIRSKEWVFGLGFIEEFGTEISINGDADFTYMFSDTIPDTLTHNEIPEIPETETIPIEWLVSTSIGLDIKGGAGLNYSENKIFLGVGRSFGWLRTGIGLAYRPIRGNMGIDLGVDADAPCTLKCNVASGEWEVNAIGNTTIKENMFRADGNTPLTGNEFDFIGGMTLDFGFLRLAGTLTGIPKTTLKLSGGTTITYISELPWIDSIYSENVVVDTVQKKVSGVIGVKLSPFPTTTETNEWEETYEVAGRIGINLGSALIIGPLTGGGAIGVNSLGEFYLSGGFESRILIKLRSSFELRNKVYQINGEKIFFPPYIVMGIGSSASFKKVVLDFGLRTNSFSTLISIIESVKEEEFPGLFELFSPVIGVSVKFE